MTTLARASSNCKRQRLTSTNPQLPGNNKNLVLATDRCFIPRETGRLTIGRTIRLRLRLNEFSAQLKVRLEREEFMCFAVIVIFGMYGSVRQLEGSCHSETT
jgi:hypothetical protein